jgi:hypothetical protein
MKARPYLFLTAAVTLWIGCIPSVNPFYRDRDVSFEPKLLGEWQEKGQGDNVTWDFQRGTDQAYKLTVTDKEGKKGTFNAHLFRLKTELFLDIIPADCEFDPGQIDLVGYAAFPGHLLLRVPAVEPELQLAFFDFDWLAKYLEKNPKALAHHLEEKRILLTATTRELQRFVMEHSGAGELFKKPDSLVRSESKSVSEAGQ